MAVPNHEKQDPRLLKEVGDLWLSIFSASRLDVTRDSKYILCTNDSWVLNSDFAAYPPTVGDRSLSYFRQQPHAVPKGGDGKNGGAMTDVNR
ncbi:MAG: hypothetical protein V7K97_05925 [Nostoc sp.]|uniref:hypothetical protein n=1 Tax=Nostoc sp. TaxID=1180 RepID=UPI002FF9C3B1